KVIKYTSRTASLQGVICDRNIHATKPFGMINNLFFTIQKRNTESIFLDFFSLSNICYCFD
ncbi:MAG: hypothetical protein MK289_23940, partial [Trichodesmium sp. ALOHA_ZT_67]|nr:hypothetical protein [Trichodesmium sp. ALOHA_ZT_67]